MIRIESRKNFIICVIVFTIIGLLLRLTGMNFIGVDYENCFLPWSEPLDIHVGLSSLQDFPGDYNMLFATILMMLKELPIDLLYSLKTLTIFFEFILVYAIVKLVMDAAEEKRYLYGALTYGLVFCSPILVINSAYLSQSESIWAAFALLSFWLIYKEHPVWGMFCLGCALSMKLQAIFILPIILLYYFKEKKFSILHILWIPVAIEVLCIPAIIGGCGWDIAFAKYFNMMGEYPFVYYFYPNIWTFMKEAPYYVFGKVAIFSAIAVLLCFSIAYIRSQRQHTTLDYIEYLCFTAMTCPFILPCMHERYNYITEAVIIALAIMVAKYRWAAVCLVLCSTLCYGQTFLAWSKVSPYLLACINLCVYIFMARNIFEKLLTRDLNGETYVKN